MVILGVLNGLLLILLGVSLYFNYKERSEMVDRLMAKSLPEYKDNQKPEPNNLSDGQENFVELDDAREEIESV